MIKHIVLFRFKDFAEGADKSENIKSLKSRLEALEDIIDEIKFFAQMFLTTWPFARSSRAKRTSTAIRNIRST